MIKKLLGLIVFASTIFYSTAAQSFFSGDGVGKAVGKLEISSPQLTNIGEESAWLPEFVVNTLSDDITKYSKIEIVDVHNEKKVSDSLKRDESASHNESEIVEVGNFSVAKNILIVSITGKTSSYAISVKINDKSSNTTLAAFNNPNCSVTDLESGLVLKKAVVEILEKIGVTLTDKGKKSLLDVGVESNATIEAQKSIAKGIIAQQNGSAIEALSYFVQAKTSDNSLARASKAIANSAVVVSSGDFGTRARNAIQIRNDFKKLLENTKVYYEKNYPYQFVYDPNPIMDEKKIDFENNSFVLTLKTAIIRDASSVDIYNSVKAAYESQPNHSNWKLDNEFRSLYPTADLTVHVQLKGKNGELLGEAYPSFTSCNYSIQKSNCDIKVSADADTNSVIIAVPVVKQYRNSNNYYSRSSNKLLYDNESWKSAPVIKISTLTASDYVNKIFYPSVNLTSTGVEGVLGVSIPKLDSVSECNRLMEYFGFPKIEEFANKKYQTNYVKYSDLVLNENESNIIYNLRRGYSSGSEDGRIFVTSDYYVIESGYLTKRSKVEYKKALIKNLPIEFEAYGGFKYLKMTDSFEKVLKEILSLESDGSYSRRYGNSNSSFANKTRYTFYMTSSLLDWTSDMDVMAYSLPDDIFKYLKANGYSSLQVVNTTNYDHSSSSGARFGHADDPLKYFAKLVSDKGNRFNYIGVYTIDNLKKLREELPKMMQLSSTHEVSKEVVSKELYNMAVNAANDAKLPYKFVAYENLNDSNFVIFVNALNEVLGYEPTLTTSDGKVVRSLSDFEGSAKAKINTGGFIPFSIYEMSGETIDKSVLKKLSKATKTTNGEMLFLVRRK